MFAGRHDDKFGRVAWAWDDQTPRLADVPAFIRCTTATVMHHGDHCVIIGSVTDLDSSAGEPLIYFDRQHDWTIGRA